MYAVTLLPSNEASHLAQEEDLSRASHYGLELDQASLAAFTESIVVSVMGLLWVCGYISATFLVRRFDRPGRPWPAVRRTLEPLLLMPQRSQGTDRQSGVHTTENRNIRVGTVEVEPGTSGSGDISVLIAVLGEPTSVADADPVLRGLGSRVRQVTLVRPISDEVAVDERCNGTAESAARSLSQAALFVSGPSPRLVLLPGRREQAIARFAAAERMEVVVLAGDPDARAELCRSPALWDCTILAPSQVSGHDHRR